MKPYGHDGMVVVDVQADPELLKARPTPTTRPLAAYAAIGTGDQKVGSLQGSELTVAFDACLQNRVSA